MADLTWIFYGRRLARLMKEGKFATMAHVVRKGKQAGVFEDNADWRTACLMFMPLEGIYTMGKKKAKAAKKQRLSSRE